MNNHMWILDTSHVVSHLFKFFFFFPPRDFFHIICIYHVVLFSLDHIGHMMSCVYLNTHIIMCHMLHLMLFSHVVPILPLHVTFYPYPIPISCFFPMWFNLNMWSHVHITRYVFTWILISTCGLWKLHILSLALFVFHMKVMWSYFHVITLFTWCHMCLYE